MRFFQYAQAAKIRAGKVEIRKSTSKYIKFPIFKIPGKFPREHTKLLGVGGRGVKNKLHQYAEKNIV